MKITEVLYCLLTIASLALQERTLRKYDFSQHVQNCIFFFMTRLAQIITGNNKAENCCSQLWDMLAQRTNLLTGLLNA